MSFFKKRREELKELQSDGDYGFPELEALKQNFDKIKAELTVKESMNSMEPLPDLPDLPESLKSSATSSMIPKAPEPGQDMSELPELPELPEDNPELYEELAKETKVPAGLKSSEKLKTRLKTAKTTTAKKTKQLFMRIDSFKEILDSVEVIKEKTEEMGLIMQKLKDIREKEGAVIKQWDLEIQELKAKLETIENTLEEVQ